MNATLPLTLPGMNEIISTARSHHMASASQKKKWTQSCAKALGRLEKLQPPVMVFIDWFEPHGRRDPDNIMAGQKFILDALVGRGFLPNDSQKEIRSISHRFHVDANNPRIELVLEEVDGEHP